MAEKLKTRWTLTEAFLAGREGPAYRAALRLSSRFSDETFSERAARDGHDAAQAEVDCLALHGV